MGKGRWSNASSLQFEGKGRADGRLPTCYVRKADPMKTIHITKAPKEKNVVCYVGKTTTNRNGKRKCRLGNGTVSKERDWGCVPITIGDGYARNTTHPTSSYNNNIILLLTTNYYYTTTEELSWSRVDAQTLNT